MRWRVGIDTGGTFTDFVLLEEASGRIVTAKCPSTPKDPAQAFVDGLVDALGRDGIAAAEVSGIFHGTTVATNAILEGTTGRTGLITTAGFRDVIEIRRHVRGQGRIYDFAFRPPDPLVPRHLRLEVAERLDARGEVLIPLDLAEARERARELIDQGVRAIAVVFLHSYANGAHEEAVKALVERELPGCFVSISSEISPELREYERASTTVINASLQPVVAVYVASLEERLRQEGIGAPLRLMQSNGGVMPAHRSAERPVHLVVSGPVGGGGARRRLRQRDHPRRRGNELRHLPRGGRAPPREPEGCRRQPHPRADVRRARDRGRRRKPRVDGRRRRASRGAAERRRRSR